MLREIDFRLASTAKGGGFDLSQQQVSVSCAAAVPPSSPWPTCSPAVQPAWLLSAAQANFVRDVTGSLSSELKLFFMSSTTAAADRGHGGSIDQQGDGGGGIARGYGRPAIAVIVGTLRPRRPLPNKPKLHRCACQPREKLELKTVSSISQVDRRLWNECAKGNGVFNPFVSWEFLSAMEESGSASRDAGWLPCHAVLSREGEEGEVLGVAPLYIKGHSYGEGRVRFLSERSWVRSPAGANILFPTTTTPPSLSLFLSLCFDHTKPGVFSITLGQRHQADEEELLSWLQTVCSRRSSAAGCWPSLLGWATSEARSWG